MMHGCDSESPRAYATPYEWLEGKRRFVRILRTLCGDGCPDERQPGRRRRPDVTPEVLVAALNWYEQEHRRRTELTREAGVRLPIEEFVAEQKLDPVEREVVEILLVCVTDLTNDESRGMTVEEMTELLALGRRDEAQKLLPYFLPGGRLRRIAAGGLAGFVGPRRLCLEDDVIASLLGYEPEPEREPAEPGPEPACRCADIAGHLAEAGVVLDGAVVDALRTVWSFISRREVIREQWGFGGLARVPSGACLLFYGPPGTGKTLTAQTLARALGREPLVINYPDLLSKWVGESQKNTRAAFDEATRAGRVLVFDEADAIFARRTEIHCASDRLANNEVNTLLMELERFSGIVILTTNHAGVLDPALERRIRHRVFFGPPDVEARAGIWRKHLPEQAPLAGDVDLDRLAEEYRLTGGQIANAVMTAAALAAARLDDGPEPVAITMADFEAGAKQEARGYDAVENGSKLGF